MAGHSHWAGIKHKKGRQDKERAKLFSKLSREITVAAKLGSTDPESNPRLRSAIQLAKGSNMPKDNIDRAIKKSNVGLTENYTSLRYEGFGPYNVAFIIETLTDNKNRSASNIRKILQKNGGRLGENGSASHLFKNCGVIRIKKTSIKENDALDIALGAGAEDIQTDDNYHEIYCLPRFLQGLLCNKVVPGEASRRQDWLLVRVDSIVVPCWRLLRPEQAFASTLHPLPLDQGHT